MSKGHVEISTPLPYHLMSHVSQYMCTVNTFHISNALNAFGSSRAESAGDKCARVLVVYTAARAIDLWIGLAGAMVKKRSKKNRSADETQSSSEDPVEPVAFGRAHRASQQSAPVARRRNTDDRLQEVKA